MADIFPSTPVPACTPATLALDAIARARVLGHGVHLALSGAGDERISLAVGAVVHAMVNELTEAEHALSQCQNRG